MDDVHTIGTGLPEASQKITILLFLFQLFFFFFYFRVFLPMNGIEFSFFDKILPLILVFRKMLYEHPLIIHSIVHSMHYGHFDKFISQPYFLFHLLSLFLATCQDFVWV